MDVNERFDQWLKSLTVKDEINSSQIKGDSAAVSGGKKKDKKKETKDPNAKKGSRDDKNDTNKNKNDAKVKDGLEDSIKLFDQYSSFYGNGISNVNTTTSSEHDDLNEILKELTSSFESSNSYYGEDNGVHGDVEPMVDISGGIHVNSAGTQSPKFLYKEPNSPNYMYFNPPTLSPCGRKSKSFSANSNVIDRTRLCTSIVHGKQMVTGYVQLDCDQNSVGFIHLKTDSTIIYRNSKL